MNYLIWSREHSRGYVVWWRPDSCGYTTDIRNAGRYTMLEADLACHRSHGDAVPVLEQAALTMPELRQIEVGRILDLLKIPR